MIARALALAVLLAGTAAGCSAAARFPHVDADTERLLPALHDGSTMHAEIETALGPPLRTFDGEHVFTYRLAREGDRLVPVPIAEVGRAPWELVIVFDAQYRLVRHTLLRLW